MERRIQLKSNFFQLQTLPEYFVYHYKVTIEPQVPPAKNRRIYEVWEEDSIEILNGILPIYDGRGSLYSVVDLPFQGQECTFTITYFEMDEFPQYRYLMQQGNPVASEFTMTLERLDMVDMSLLTGYLHGEIQEMPKQPMHVLDTLLRHNASLSYKTVGRCFYTPETSVSLTDGAVLWTGFHQSLHACRGRLLLNLDVSATPFYQPGSLLQIVEKILGFTIKQNTQLTEKEIAKLEKQLVGCKLVLVHRGAIQRKYRIHSFTLTNGQSTLFPRNEDSKLISVADYFAANYAPLQFPGLPCVVVGNPQRPGYMPIEVCDLLPGQRHLKRLSERQTSEMIKFTTQQPQVRKSKIDAGLDVIQDAQDPYMQTFGVGLEREMLVIPAKVLPSPVLSYHPASKEPEISPWQGTWNLKDKMVTQGVTLASWAIVVFASPKDYNLKVVQDFVRMLVETTEECGIFVPAKNPPVVYQDPRSDVEQTFQQGYMKAGNTFNQRPQLLFCILPSTNIQVYSEIKRVSDTVIGVVSQCIQGKNVLHPKRQYCANVALKMNAKLGGMNGYLSNQELALIYEKPTLVIGADLVHTNNVYIAALVCNMDAQCARYSASLRHQSTGLEILDLKEMMMDQLRKFYQQTKEKPQSIIFYRNNCPDNERDLVFRKELEMLHQACAEIEQSYHPSITFILVQQRHHAKFFPTRQQDCDKFGNVFPGTVIDSDITKQHALEFYLCSHPGLQGTSRPTHYQVMHDDNKLSLDKIENLTYRLCFLYCKATRSVSIVPPLYYAYLICQRARFHLQGDSLQGVHPILEQGMYFI
ncbi:Piwi domain-containing protein [Gorgonomyces haynaldii]|nr:Piwi domain-containing protein [Gorgonomyces haynaldii]